MLERSLRHFEKISAGDAGPTFVSWALDGTVSGWCHQLWVPALILSRVCCVDGIHVSVLAASDLGYDDPHSTLYSSTSLCRADMMTSDVDPAVCSRMAYTPFETVKQHAAWPRRVAQSFPDHWNVTQPRNAARTTARRNSMTRGFFDLSSRKLLSYLS